MALSLFAMTVSPTAGADTIDVQPVGSAAIPEGPAPAWIIADMDTGQILAGRNEDAHSAPASTIKTLLAQVVLDEVPLDSTIVATEADTAVECNCAGVTPGRRTPPANCWTACCWCRATTRPTPWRACSAGPMPP